jgi:1-acyl-sn-glycerol-3-phosphate acyltransferase
MSLQSKERHLKPPPPLAEFIRNQMGRLVHRANFTAEGLENVEGLEGGAIIIAAPHNGHMDTILTRMAFEPEFRELMVAAAGGDYWEQIGRKQLANSFARIFPISRESGVQAYRDLKQIAALVIAGERVVIFPEGTRHSDPNTPISERSFMPGIGLLALMTGGGIPIIPLHIKGNERIMPRGETFPQFRDKKSGKPYTITIKVGEPLDLSALTQESMKEMSRSEIKQEAETIAGIIHGFFISEEHEQDTE